MTSNTETAGGPAAPALRAVIAEIHHGYLAAGVDCITTNTCGAKLGNLGEYGISDRIFELAAAGARITRTAADRWPDLEDRAKVMRLLPPERTGVTLSEEFQLAPEQSTGALIAHHPEAKYFST